MIREPEKEPSISCCMIVKNEEGCLGRCLRSVCDHVDEIIIVDTGSTDRTVEIAKSYGARVYLHPWENDFSKHRNQSLSYATSDWIFQLDADEELFEEDGPKLSEILRHGKADYYHCRFYDMKKDGSVHGSFYLIRLFRNRMGMRYERKVHNQLQTRGREAYSSIRVRHYGYDLSKEQMEAKHIRTTRLLKETLSKDPEDVYSIFQLAASYSMRREFDKAVEYGEMALDIMRLKKLKNSFFLTAFHTVAQGYHALGKVEEAERVCLEALDLYPMHLDMCHLLAAVYFRRHSFDLCRDISQRYLSIYETFENTPSLMSFYCHSFAKRNEIYFGLACIHFIEKGFSSADEFFLKAFQDSSSRLEMAESICRFYYRQGMDEKALQWLKISYEAGLHEGRVPPILLDRNNLYLKIGQMYLQQGNLELATDSMKKSRDEFLTSNEQLEKRLSLATLSWMSGEINDLAKNLETLMIILGRDTNPPINTSAQLAHIVYDLAEVFCLRQQWHLAEGALKLAVQISPAVFDYAKFDRLLLAALEENHPGS